MATLIVRSWDNLRYQDSREGAKSDQLGLETGWLLYLLFQLVRGLCNSGFIFIEPEVLVRVQDEGSDRKCRTDALLHEALLDSLVPNHGGGIVSQVDDTLQVTGDHRYLLLRIGEVTEEFNRDDGGFMNIPHGFKMLPIQDHRHDLTTLLQAGYLVQNKLSFLMTCYNEDTILSHTNHI